MVSCPGLKPGTEATAVTHGGQRVKKRESLRVSDSTAQKGSAGRNELRFGGRHQGGEGSLKAIGMILERASHPPCWQIPVAELGVRTPNQKANWCKVGGVLSKKDCWGRASPPSPPAHRRPSPPPCRGRAHIVKEKLTRGKRPAPGPSKALLSPSLWSPWKKVRRMSAGPSCASQNTNEDTLLQSSKAAFTARRTSCCGR